MLVLGGTALVTYKYLLKKGIPKSTLYNNTSKKCKKPWVVVNHPENKKAKLISYDSIPFYFIDKYNLPQFSELVATVNEIAEKKNNENNKNTLLYLKAIFDLEAKSWHLVHHHYAHISEDADKIENYCKTHLLLLKCIELRDMGYNYIDLFNTYSLYDGLVFKSKNLNSFCNKLRNIRNADHVENELVHGLLFRKSNNVKCTDDVINEIINHYINPKKFNGPQILEKVNDYLLRQNKKTISLSKIEKTISQRDIKNKAIISRFGEKYFMNQMLPHAHFVAPLTEGALWCADGTKFQFAYRSEKKKYDILTYYVVLDGRSKKIVGYSYGDSENLKLALSAMENACRNTGYLAREIIVDDSPAHKPEAYKSNMNTAKKWGCNWRIIESHNPRDNAYVERFFGVFQEQVCKKYEGYLGDGIKSRNLNGRPSPEEIKKFLTNKNLKTHDELVSLLNRLIVEYNSSERIEKNIEKALSNGEIKRKIEATPIKLSPEKFANLFWQSTEVKVHNGMISFILAKKNYIYNIYDEIILINYHGLRVKIRYNPDDFSKIMVFSIEDNSYLCSLDLMSPIPKVLFERTREQDVDLGKHIGKQKKMKDSIKGLVKKVNEESKKNNELLPPELSLFSPVAKLDRETNEEKIIEEELEKINGCEVRIPINIPNKDLSYKEQFERMYKKNILPKSFEYGRN